MKALTSNVLYSSIIQYILEEIYFYFTTIYWVIKMQNNKNKVKNKFHSNHLRHLQSYLRISTYKLNVCYSEVPFCTMITYRFVLLSVSEPGLWTSIGVGHDCGFGAMHFPAEQVKGHPRTQTHTHNQLLSVSVFPVIRWRLSAPLHYTLIKISETLWHMNQSRACQGGPSSSSPQRSLIRLLPNS